MKCSQREELLMRFRRALDHYHHTFVSLLDTIPIEKAIDETHALYEVCVVAREALRSHEQEHGCFRERPYAKPE
jgi:hypothetical protein